MSRNIIRYLRFQIHGIVEHPRRSPRRARRGPARNWKYRAWIRSLPSAVSDIEGTGLIEAAHTGVDGGMSMKASDYSCIPLTIAEHREYHQVGKDAFELLHSIDCREIVTQLNHVWFGHSGEIK